jgi:hypothetical protein
MVLSLLAVVVGLAAGGCGPDSTEPVPQRLECALPITSSIPAWTDSNRRWSEYFASQIHGGFGGWYLLENEGVFAFRLIDMDEAQAAADHLRALLVTSPYSVYASLDFRPEPGRYDFLELSGCRNDVALAIGQSSMVTAVSIDERMNKVAIGVASAADSSTAQGTVNGKYPADLVRIFVQPLVTPAAF